MNPPLPTYHEDRCALRWPLVVFGIGMPVLIVLCVIGGLITGNHGFIWLAAVPVFVWIFTNSGQILQYWPLGIRIDDSGVRIGRVRHPDRAPRKPPMPVNQSYYNFTAGWTDVLSLEVVTDRDRLSQLRKVSRSAPMAGTAKRGATLSVYLGMLVPPFTRAALVIEVDPDGVRYPEFGERQSLGVSNSVVGTKSATWVVPTRQPDQLTEIVSQITNSPTWRTRYT